MSPETCIRCGEPRANMRETLLGLVCARCTGELRRRDVLGEEVAVRSHFDHARATYDAAEKALTALTRDPGLGHEQHDELSERRAAEERARRRARFERARAEIRDCPDCHIEERESEDPIGIVLTLRSRGFSLCKHVHVYRDAPEERPALVEKATRVLRYEQRCANPCLTCQCTGKVNGLGEAVSPPESEPMKALRESVERLRGSHGRIEVLEPMRMISFEEEMRILGTRPPSAPRPPRPRADGPAPGSS